MACGISRQAWEIAGSPMSSAENTENNTPKKDAKTPLQDGSDAPAWADGLKQLYNSVVDEPLPDSFQDLLDAFDEGTGPGEDDAGTGKSN